MLIEKRSFFSGMNGDISPRLLDDKSCLNIMNARQGSSTYGRSGRLENLPGSTIIPQTVFPPYGTQQTIGSVFDAKRGRLIWANYDTLDFHGIYAYDLVTEITYAVIYDSQVTGGLGFSKDSRINRNMKVIGDLLYWTDDLNRQRKINIERGIVTNNPSYVSDETAYDWPMNQEVISLLKRPPLLPLQVNKVYQTIPALTNNFIKNEAFEFLARYYYKDGETSVVSVYSQLLNYNVSTDNFNRIDITFQLLEEIEQDVQRVDLIVRIGNTNDFYVIKFWDKDNADDAAEIAAHNAGTANLSYSFYNDKLGEKLDYNGYVYKPFDSVPIQSKTLEIAKNRLYLGNNVIGYDTPTITSLTAAFVEDSEGGTVTGSWVSISYGMGATHYFIDIQGIGDDSGFYDTSGISQPPPFPASVDIVTDVVKVADGPADFALYVVANFPFWTGGIVYTGDVSTITGTSPVSLNGAEGFKTDAFYQIGIVFYDFGDRKCGVVTTEDNIYKTPDREYDTITWITSLDWTLVNTNAVNEIPDWATHYSIVINKCLRTRFFLQARAKNITYVTKDADGEYVFDEGTFSDDQNGVGIDITSLNSFGMGYTFAEGDLVKVYIDGDATVYTLAITGQSGNWIICELRDLGALGDLTTPKTDTLFEIYTPYRASTNEPFFEVAQTYPVNNPGTLLREYSTITGSIGGDISLLTRTDATDDYLTENMSPNDSFPYVWNTDAGRVNLISPFGQVHETNTIAFSNTYIIGSRVNGLSSFDPLNESDIPLEYGQIQKLQLTSKIQNEQGVVMLGICEVATASIYLGEVQQYGSNQQTTLTISEQVIGTINAMKRNRGTSNPETVVEYDGLVKWLDVVNGKVVQYSNNGLEDVSRYGQERFFKRYCDDYLVTSTASLDAINGFHHIPTCFDTFHKEWIITLPALIYDNYAEVLPSYGGVVPSYATSIFNRFDIFDSLGKTMAFQYEENKWGSDYEWMPEWFEYGANILFAFKNGQPYTMYTNTTNWNTVFGVEYPVRFCLTGNYNPSALKVLNDIAIEGNRKPDYTVAMADYPNEQITDLAGDDLEWVDQEGQFYAEFLMDRLSPNATGTADERLFTGDPITDIVIKVMCEFQEYEQLMYVNFVNLGYSLSRGQKQILNIVNQ